MLSVKSQFLSSSWNTLALTRSALWNKLWGAGVLCLVLHGPHLPAIHTVWPHLDARAKCGRSSLKPTLENSHRTLSLVFSIKINQLQSRSMDSLTFSFLLISYIENQFVSKVLPHKSFSSGEEWVFQANFSVVTLTLLCFIFLVKIW